MSAHEQILDTTRKAKEAVPRGNLSETEFETRIETWRNYLADAVNGPKFEVEETPDEIRIEGESVVSENKYEFFIPFDRDIDTKYGMAKGCKLERLYFYPKSSGEQIRAYYAVSDLPDGIDRGESAEDTKTDIEITVTYDAESNSQLNVCLNQDKYGYLEKGSPRMIPLIH